MELDQKFREQVEQEAEEKKQEIRDEFVKDDAEEVKRKKDLKELKKQKKIEKLKERKMVCFMSYWSWLWLIEESRRKQIWI